MIREKRRFKPTELGFLVTDLLVKGFPNILDTTFTAQMETNLDRIERGETKWTNLMGKFYMSFQKALDAAEKGLKGEVETDITCTECGRVMAIKSGKAGLFLACTGYPECKNTSNFTRDEKGKIIVEKIPEVSDEEDPCEKCGRPMTVKNGKYGPFLACSGYPDCKNTRPIAEKGDASSMMGPTDIKCKECGARMVLKMNRKGQRFFACEKYPQCKYTESVSTNVPCPNDKCKGMLVEKSSRRGRRFYACNQYPQCNFAMWDEPFNDTCPECGTKVLAIKERKGAGTILTCRKKGCEFTKPPPES